MYVKTLNLELFNYLESADYCVLELFCCFVFLLVIAPDVMRSDEDADTFKAPPLKSEDAGLTLHDVMLAEKSDFDAKMNRIARRKKWLKANQQLLSTLLSYGVLHGSCGGGLASMHMELLLLLQELQQEQTRQQLLSPLPFPTTLPLLSASVASAKMVIADPIQHLQGMCQDLLHSIIELQTPPSTDMMPSKVMEQWWRSAFIYNLSM